MEVRDIKEMDSEQLDGIRRLMEYLSCPSRMFRPMADDGELMEAYYAARQRGKREGFTPMLVRCDELLLEGMLENSDPESEEDFSHQAVEQYRQSLLSRRLPSGAVIQEDLLAGAVPAGDGAGMQEGGEIEGFCSYWSETGDRTDFVLLCEIPVKNPWEVFAYLPMGGWNNCPAPARMMAAAKHWYEQYGAMPAAMSHNILEFALEEKVPAGQCITLAREQSTFCPERVLTCGEDCSVDRLAGDLARSNLWFFIWD